MPDFRRIDPAATYTQAEAAALTGRASGTVRAAIRSGALRATRKGSAYRIAGADLAVAVAARASTPGQSHCDFGTWRAEFSLTRP